MHLSRLRKVLHAHEEPVLTTCPAGYTLRVAPGTVDVDRFERLLDHGLTVLAQGSSAAAAESAHDALALWRGKPFVEFTYDTFAQPEIARLEERKMVALDLRVEAQLALGRHASVLPDLEALVREHPLRERLHAHLMLALYRSGRQGDALGAYQAARRVLREGLGIEPTPELRRLERAILQQDAALEPAAVKRREWPQAPRSLRRRVWPCARTGLIRNADRAAVLAKR
jgi:DNA-binding SARP family transcriptional activator